MAQDEQRVRRGSLERRLLVMLSLSDMFQLLGAGDSERNPGQASGTGKRAADDSGHDRVRTPLLRGLELWQTLAEDAGEAADMTAVWWLSRHSLFLASSDSALGASVHHAPGLDGNRTEMGEGGGGVGRQAAHGVPCDLYHPDAAQGGGAGSSSALGLSVPATVVLLQRLVQTELAMLLRHLSSVCSNSPPEGVSATTAHGQHAGGAGKRSGFPREESEWRVGRVVCLAHAACCLAARSPRYHHTLYLFFKVTPVVLPACLHACIPACLHACIPACLHACMPACQVRDQGAAPTDGRSI